MRKMWSNIVSGVLVACALAVTVAVVRQAFWTPAPPPPASPEPRAVEEWHDLAGSGSRMGPEDAAVVIVEFADFQCPFCATEADNLRRVLSRYPEDLAVVFRHFPLQHIHPHAYTAAVAAECAGAQDRFGPFHDLLFDRQDQIGKADWSAFAAMVDTDTAAFHKCMNEAWPKERVDEDLRTAKRLGLTGTPSVIVDGLLLPGTPSADVLREHIDRALQQNLSTRRRQPGGNGEHIERIPDAGPSRPWRTGPWLSLDPNNTRTATGYNLDDFRHVTLDAEGRAHVVDRSNKKVVVFDLDLQFSHAVALLPVDQNIRIDVLGRDSIATLDRRTGLASVRSARTGEVASQFIVSGAGTYYPYAIWAFGRGAGFLTAYTSSYTPDNAFQKDRQNFIRLLDRNGEVVRDSVFLFRATEKLVANTERGISVGPHPFGATSYVRVLAGATVVHASSDQFALNLFDVEKEAATSFSYPLEPAWVSDAELKAAAAQKSPGNAAALLAEGRRARQALVGLAVDNLRETIWVGVWSPPGTNREWAAFDTSGTHLASVALPADFVLHGVWQDRLVGIDYSAGEHAPVLQSFRVLRENEPQPGFSRRGPV